jgi:DNA topoisomerase-1
MSGNTSLSAGRVQSVALKLICDRESEIEKFIKTEYWSIWAVFNTEKNESFKAKLFGMDGKDIKMQPKPVMSDEEWQEFLAQYISLSDEKITTEVYNRISSTSVYYKQLATGSFQKAENEAKANYDAGAKII